MRDDPGPRSPGDPHDVPGWVRATGIDDPVPNAEFGDTQSDRPSDWMVYTGEERVELPIPDGAEYDIDDPGDGMIIVQWWADEVGDR